MFTLKTPSQTPTPAYTRLTLSCAVPRHPAQSLNTPQPPEHTAAAAASAATAGETNVRLLQTPQPMNRLLPTPPRPAAAPVQSQSAGRCGRSREPCLAAPCSNSTHLAAAARPQDATHRDRCRCCCCCRCCRHQAGVHCCPRVGCWCTRCNHLQGGSKHTYSSVSLQF